MKPKEIGIIGVGLMGLGIATNIIKNGWSVSFLNHEGNQPCEGLLSAGAKSFESGKSLAEHCDIILLCVTGSPQVEAVLTNPDGVLAGLKSGSIVIDCSTSMPSLTKLLAKLVIERGGEFLDAPMTRTPKEAMEGRLNLIVGGNQDVFLSILPLLESFGENITHVGGIGSGHSMKLLHNYVSLGFTAVLAEAAACAAKAQIDPEKFVEILAKGGGNSVVLERLTPFILENDPSGLMFTLANAHKDIGYYAKMAEVLGAEKQTAEGVLALFSNQLSKAKGELMLPEIISSLTQDAD